MMQWVARVWECPDVLRTILEPMARIIVELSREINELDRRIEKLGKEQYPATQLLRSVDGVGPLTSLAYVLELNNDVGRVKRSRQMGAVVGCRPKQRDSGESSPEFEHHEGGEPDATAAAGAVVPKDNRTFWSGIGLAELGIGVGGAGQEAGQAASGGGGGAQAGGRAACDVGEEQSLAALPQR